ncbi:MAG: hypothetical protein O6759_07665, partial [Candidatus Dadabacteria bacterium]|nr:hypothetical protein [Candidatus Dadabacteria bacterium]
MSTKNPMHPEEITPEWLTFALKESGVIEKASVIDVKRTIIGGGKGFKSSVVRVGVKYDQAESDAPTSVVAKIEPEDESVQAINKKFSSFEREISFYKQVAPSAPIRLPVLYYAVEEPPAYSMLMEDLSSLTPGDQTVGMHESQVMATVETMGKLQAKYWNNNLLEELSWMPTLEDLFMQYDESNFIENCISFLEHFGFVIGLKAIMIGYKLKDNINWLKDEILSRKKT